MVSFEVQKLGKIATFVRSNAVSNSTVVQITSTTIPVYEYSSRREE